MPRPFRPATHLLRPLVLALFVAIAAACGSDQGAAPEASPETTEGAAGAANDDTTTTGSPDGPVSFSEHVLPTIEATCARCHTEGGPGTGHLEMTSAADIADNALDIAAVVGARAMPPWPASQHSVDFANDWSLDDDQIAAIVDWHAAGAELDVDPATDIVASTPVIALTDADDELVPPTGYAGVAGQPDEYRCFVYDPQLSADRFLSAYEFVPDQTEVVHHAIGYIVDGSRRNAAADLDGADGNGGGWSCFGSSGLGEDEIFLGWAPGQAPSVFPDGTGLRVGAGDFIVIQVHYHFEVDAPEDRSSLRVKWTDELSRGEVDLIEFFAPAEIPCMTTETGPLCDRAAAVEAAIAKYGPAGVFADRWNAVCGVSPADFAHMTDGIAWSSCDLDVRGFGTIHSVLGHMHEIGATFRMTLNPDTPDEVVLLDIPRWDFDWQLNYEPIEEISVSPADTIRVECSWDRSLRDPNLEPSYVLWADGTNDEMCFATVTVY